MKVRQRSKEKGHQPLNFGGGVGAGEGRKEQSRRKVKWEGHGSRLLLSSSGSKYPLSFHEEYDTEIKMRRSRVQVSMNRCLSKSAPVGAKMKMSGQVKSLPGKITGK